MSDRPARALAGAVALCALGAMAAAPALGSGLLKRPNPAPALGAMPARAHAAHAIGEAALLITFADAPSRAAADRRLGGLGRVSPVVPEAGVWRLRPSGRPLAARAVAAGRPAVVAAEWAISRTSDEVNRPTAPTTAGPIADPVFADGTQWGLGQGRAPSWTPDLTTVGPRTRIAVLDGGIDRGHEEWRGPASPLVAPRNTIQRDADATDWGTSGHGTHVAGIAAAPINGVGIVGVAPSGPGAGEVIPVRIADPDGRSTDATMIAGIRWAVLRGARVVNISAGGPGYSRAFQETILWATARGALIVASVGNDGETAAGRVVNYPAGYKRVLGVGAQCDRLQTGDCPRPFGVARFSNRNTSVDLIAPGVRVASSVPVRVTDGALSPGYAYKDGTSMAAPYVAGVAALVQAANGNRLSPYQVLRQLQNTATRIESGGRTNRSGYGVVDPARAVTRIAPPDDVDEVNDDIKWAKAPRPIAPGRPIRIDASVDRLHDEEDVYAVRARAGDRIQVTLSSRSGAIDLYLWDPRARTVRTSAANVRRNLLGFRGGAARVKRMTRTAERSGVHHVNVYARRGRGDYTLTITLRRA
jgi:hypothetical protein